MNPLISVPRQALGDLLRKSGSKYRTPEEWLASLKETKLYTLYPGRARAAAVSAYFLIAAAVISILCVFISFCFENVLLAIIITGIAWVEHFTLRGFRTWDKRAPIMGCYNQIVFASIIVLYGTYNAFLTGPIQIPADYKDSIDPDMLGWVSSGEKLFYILVAVIGGGSQYLMAWYYYRAKSDNES